MIPGVFVTDSDNNIGTVGLSVEDVCGMIFDTSKQASFSFAKAEQVIEMTSTAALEANGITEELLGGIPLYHINQFFTKRGGTGRLFVMFADCSKDWKALSKLQRYAHGLIYQVGVWTEQELWSLESADASVYSLKMLAAIESEAVNIANNMNTPMSVLLYPNTNKLAGTAGASAQVSFNKIPTVKSDYRYVSVMLGESAEADVLGMQDALTSKAPVGAMGADLATISMIGVQDCMGYVGACDYSGYIPVVAFGFGENKTPYEEVDSTVLSDLNDKGYNFFMKYEGDEVGVYRNFDHTCTDGDYRTIARNRTIGKVRRMVRAALLPKVNKTVLVNPANGFLAASAQADFVNTVSDVLGAMVTAGEISGYTTPVINQTASILKTDAVYINFSVVPVGTASAIYVTEGLSLTA